MQNIQLVCLRRCSNSKYVIIEKKILWLLQV